MQRPLVYPSSRSSIGLCIVYLGIFRFLMTSGRTAVAAAFRVSTPPPRAPSAVGRRLVCSSRWTRQQRSLFGSYEIHRSSMHRGLPILQLPARSLSSRRSSSATTTTCLMMDAIDEDEAIDSTKRIDSTWSIPGLKKEVARLVMRSHKKIGKAHTRLSTAKQELEKLTADPNASLEQLEQCPNTDAIEFELQELQERLGRLNQLEEALQAVKAKESVLPESIAHLALDLGVDDKPPQRPPRGPRKKKGPRVMESTRLPYRRFYTEDNTEIRVRASENERVVLLCHCLFYRPTASSIRSENKQKIMTCYRLIQNIVTAVTGGCMQVDAQGVMS
jgi:hypothetical protein